ncbi:hypothetical protein BDK51DRAFT_36963 [Blyttiomyces helicus]|uniref:Uncharacterized protein n=1 Tax=Blyttiomyces helicus TaxID=388810 RepID=A0A4V1IQ42_9FUNG|nr:hypothetical protein BDK51DRAFT_36963 [Blyttiomyces helicus]|eukprot:RKO85247.1 hypothetical protein BDK51DRAFT_36963 [Blyttiomyces helicus]
MVHQPAFLPAAICLLYLVGTHVLDADRHIAARHADALRSLRILIFQRIAADIEIARASPGAFVFVAGGVSAPLGGVTARGLIKSREGVIALDLNGEREGHGFAVGEKVLGEGGQGALAAAELEQPSPAHSATSERLLSGNLIILAFVDRSPPADVGSTPAPNPNFLPLHRSKRTSVMADLPEPAHFQSARRAVERSGHPELLRFIRTDYFSADVSEEDMLATLEVLSHVRAEEKSRKEEFVEGSAQLWSSPGNSIDAILRYVGSRPSVDASGRARCAAIDRRCYDERLYGVFGKPPNPPIRAPPLEASTTLSRPPHEPRPRLKNFRVSFAPARSTAPTASLLTCAPTCRRLALGPAAPTVTSSPPRVPRCHAKKSAVPAAPASSPTTLASPLTCARTESTPRARPHSVPIRAAADPNALLVPLPASTLSPANPPRAPSAPTPRGSSNGAATSSATCASISAKSRRLSSARLASG